MASKILSVEERGELYERMCRSIVCIYDEFDELKGGGVFLEVGSKHLVLTAAHVGAGKRDLRIACYDKTTYAAQVLHHDPARDVALLDILNKPEDGFVCAQLYCGGDELSRGSEIHFIGHPGGQTFAYKVGNISCVEKTCISIYRALNMHKMSKFERIANLEAKKNKIIDDFSMLDDSVRLIQAKNVHGCGRFGGTGAPFLDSDGNIVGLYSFTFQAEDHAIHVAEINASIAGFNHKGKGKKTTTRSQKSHKSSSVGKSRIYK
ncbi:hypothetical protein DCAR_0101925 [Daucus carota subsp. sativus]|uniref:Peptidase S1 domain-containing protein n=1 Tax=Daucus carota subsp. sativus TaxID=79200 RepID=A0A166GR63_DAUCS|nr:PREDICTED: uncharacterized protein LOC108220263 [Daucus carota subsp. sativus]WOG82757.1 hypothetical protein DCAR_0101925 [Daucus carota subsp. sativus]